MTKDYKSLSMGLLTNQIEGAWISVKQAGPKKTQQMVIELKLFNKKHAMINNVSIDRCVVAFDRAIIRVASESSTNSTVIEVKRAGTDEWLSCITN